MFSLSSIIGRCEPDCPHVTNSQCEFGHFLPLFVKEMISLPTVTAAQSAVSFIEVTGNDRIAGKAETSAYQFSHGSWSLVTAPALLMSEDTVNLPHISQSVNPENFMEASDRDVRKTVFGCSICPPWTWKSTILHPFRKEVLLDYHQVLQTYFAPCKCRLD